MDKERIIEWKRMETTQEHRKGLILYLILFFNYLILILWKEMDQSNGQGTHHRMKKNGNNTERRKGLIYILIYSLIIC